MISQNKNAPSRLSRLSVALAASLMMSPAVHAYQENNDNEQADVADGKRADVSDSKQDGLKTDTITVTATRRSQSVLDIPSNISAISESELAQNNVQDFSKLTKVVPGLQFTDKGVRDNSTSSRLIVRGINTESPGFADVPFVTVSPVATYIDETPIYANLRMNDVSRVEVMRGPQGTLYGSGSLGGTIRFIHNKPDIAGFEGKVEAGIGTVADSGDQNYSLSTVINIPMGEHAAFRMSAGHDTYAGFIDAKRLAVLGADGVAEAGSSFDEPRLEAKDDVNSAEVSFVRASVLFEPTEKSGKMTGVLRR